MGITILLFALSNFCPSYVAGNIEFTFPWEESQIRKACFSTPETSPISSPEQDNKLLQIMATAGSSEHSEFITDTGSSSLNDLKNVDPAQCYRSTGMSTTPPTSALSIEQLETKIFLQMRLQTHFLQQSLKETAIQKSDSNPTDHVVRTVIE